MSPFLASEAIWGCWGHLRSFKAIEANSLTRGQVRLCEAIEVNWDQSTHYFGNFSARKLLRFCLFSKNSLNFQTTVNIFRIVFWIYLHSGWKKPEISHFVLNWAKRATTISINLGAKIVTFFNFNLFWLKVSLLCPFSNHCENIFNSIVFWALNE